MIKPDSSLDNEKVLSDSIINGSTYYSEPSDKSLERKVEAYSEDIKTKNWSSNLRPYPKLFQKFSNSLSGYFLTAGPIICGVALAGSVIPFFINTKIPFLLWLSNYWVLIPLVAISAVVWAAIYGAEINNILEDMFWGSKFSAKKKPSVLYSKIIQYAKFISEIKDSNTTDEDFLLLQKLVKTYYENTGISSEELLSNVKLLSEYLDHNRSPENRTHPENTVFAFCLEFINDSIKEETSNLNNSLENKEIPTEETVLPTEDTYENEENRILREKYGESALLKIEAEIEMLNLNKKYPIQKTKFVFDILGWLNAFLVNSVGVAISGLSIIAFCCDILFKAGYLSTANIPVALATITLVICFAAGAVAASVLTRLRTKDVGENMSYAFYGWLEKDNKLAIFTTKNFIIFSSLLIALIVAIGFAGFNYYTGFYFGSMLVEIMNGNLENLVDPKYILDARNSNSSLGIIFALIGFALTIVSTSSFLYEVVYGWVNSTAKKIGDFFPKLHEKNDWVSDLQAYIIISLDIFAIAILLNINSFNLSSAMFASTITLSLILLVSSLALAAKYPVKAKENIGSFMTNSVVLIMAFSCAAVAAIGTAKVGSFWYTYLPSFLATTPLLQMYGSLVFAAAMLAFPAVFSGAFTDINAKFKEWRNPKHLPEVYTLTDLKNSDKNLPASEIINNNSSPVKEDIDGKLGKSSVNVRPEVKNKDKSVDNDNKDEFINISLADDDEQKETLTKVESDEAKEIADLFNQELNIS
ncbi:MAG: hypothetical protein VX335_03510 [Pseudomonadota bacterium]|nr:hypothetical protein [Pseudomonadota bacterium]